MRRPAFRAPIFSRSESVALVYNSNRQGAEPPGRSHGRCHQKPVCVEREYGFIRGRQVEGRGFRLSDGRVLVEQQHYDRNVRDLLFLLYGMR